MKREKVFTAAMAQSKERGDFSVVVSRYYTDTSGAILDKNTVAQSLKVKFPFFLFHKFDHSGGYKIASSICPPIAGVYLYTFTPGASFDYFSFQFGNTIKAKYDVGDIVHVFSDSLNSPSVLIYVIIHSRFQPYAGILEDSKGNIETTSVLYFTDNQLNYNEAIHLIKSNALGIYKDDQFQPLAFKSPEMFQNNFIEMPFNVRLNSNVGFASYLQFASDQLEFSIKSRY